MGTPVRSQDWSPHPLGNASTISTSISGTPTPEGRTYNAQNQFDTVGGNSLSYDNNGNLIVDQQGNLYKFDAWNRLVRVEDSMSTLMTAYTYDALNHRIIEDDGIAPTHLFYSVDWQVLEEQVSGQATTQYVWSPVYIDAMILRDRDTDANGSLDERLYVQQDANWNVTALVDASTGDVVQRFVQDPFGLVTDFLNDTWSPQSDAFDWKYLHQGLRLDQAIGMNLYDGRNRIYDPVLQRWFQMDPSGFDAGDSNLYRYVGNGPVTFTDALGLEDPRRSGMPRVPTMPRFNPPPRIVRGVGPDVGSVPPVTLGDPVPARPGPVVTLGQPRPAPRSNTFVPIPLSPTATSTSMSVDEYWTKWKVAHPGLEDDQYKRARNRLDYGCVGISSLALGVDAMPNLTNCYSTFERVKKRQDEMLANNMCAGKVNSYGQPSQPLIFSVRFWSGGKSYAPNADGKVDMSQWAYKSKPKPGGGGYTNFDFGLYDVTTDRWLHANHAHAPSNPHVGPMTVKVSTLDYYSQRLLDFDKQVFCVACQDWQFGKAARKP